MKKFLVGVVAVLAVIAALIVVPRFFGAAELEEHARGGELGVYGLSALL
jgi:hypothetical protein